MRKWEYRILINVGFDERSRNCTYRIDGTLQDGKTDNFVDVLNDAGRDGWEVVSTCYEPEEGIAYLLKRPVT